MRILPWLLIIGLCAFGFYEQREARLATEANAAVQEELTVTKAKLETALIDSVTKKNQLERNLKEIADMEKVKGELADLQGKMKESEAQEQVSKAVLEDSKKQMEEATSKIAEIEVLKQKMAELENQVTVAKSERDAAKTQATALQTEVQRLQQQPPKPPFGSTIGTRR